jgi:hypothetical protein
MGTLGTPPTRLTVVPDKWVRPTRRPADLVCGSNRPSWRPTRPPEDFPEDSPDDLIQTRKQLGVQVKEVQTD